MEASKATRSFEIGWRLGLFHGDLSVGEAETLLRDQGDNPEALDMDALMNGADDGYRGDRWRLDRMTRPAPLAEVRP